MTKQEFLTALEAGLSELPRQEVEQRISFYSEMIDDYVEDGLDEKDAVRSVGSLNEIIRQSMAERSLLHQLKERVLPQRSLTGLEIALIILGAPVWLSLLAGMLVILGTGYVAIWTVAVVMWSVFAALLASGLGCLAAAVMLAVQGHGIPALAVSGAGLVCAGASILMFYAGRQITTGIVWISKKIAAGIRSLLGRKGDAK